MDANEVILVQNLQAGNYQGEVPGGAVNDVNTTFTLAAAPSPAASLFLFSNGSLLKAGAGEDYTLSGSTLTMAFAPQTGTKLIAFYLRDTA